MSTDASPPVRLCCGLRHWGSQCPDGLVMCCLCFERKTEDQLSLDPESGKKENVCLECARKEQTHMKDTKIDPDEQRLLLRISPREFATVLAALHWWGSFTSTHPSDVDTYVAAEAIAKAVTDEERLDEAGTLALKERLQQSVEEYTTGGLPSRPRRLKAAGVLYEINQPAANGLYGDWLTCLWRDSGNQVCGTTYIPDHLRYVAQNGWALTRLSPSDLNRKFQHLSEDALAAMMKEFSAGGWMLERNSRDPALFNDFQRAVTAIYCEHQQWWVGDLAHMLVMLESNPDGWMAVTAVKLLMSWNVLKVIEA